MDPYLVKQISDFAARNGYSSDNLYPGNEVGNIDRKDRRAKTRLS